MKPSITNDPSSRTVAEWGSEPRSKSVPSGPSASCKKTIKTSRSFDSVTLLCLYSTGIIWNKTRGNENLYFIIIYVVSFICFHYFFFFCCFVTFFGSFCFTATIICIVLILILKIIQMPTFKVKQNLIYLPKRILRAQETFVED